MEIWKLRGSLRCLNKFVVQEVPIPPKCSPGFTILKTSGATHYKIPRRYACHVSTSKENWELRLLLFDTNMLFHLFSMSVVYIARVIFIRVNMIYLIPLDEQSFPVQTFLFVQSKPNMFASFVLITFPFLLGIYFLSSHFPLNLN